MTSVSKNKVILEERQCMFMLKWSNDADLKPECDNRKKWGPEGKIIGILL